MGPTSQYRAALTFLLAATAGCLPAEGIEILGTADTEEGGSSEAGDEESGVEDVAEEDGSTGAVAETTVDPSGGTSGSTSGVPTTGTTVDPSGGVSSTTAGPGTTMVDPSTTGEPETTAGDASTTGAETTTGETTTGPEIIDTEVRAPELIGYGSGTTGGQGGAEVTVSTGTELHRAICERAADDTPLVIYVDGVITPGNTTRQSGSCETDDGRIELKNISNISIIGVEDRGILDQTGVHLRGASNIILQNLTIRNVRKSNTDTPSNDGDAIGMEDSVDHVWVDHNEIYGSTTEGEEHDGLLDFKRDCTNITVSYNHFHDSGRGGLIASNDDGDDGSTNFTFHHNWYENINSRTHLVREAHAHFFNNYYSQILSTGLNVRNGATIRVDGNYFEDSRNPLGTFFFLDNNPVYEVQDNIFDGVTWEEADDQVPAGPDVQSTGSVSVSYSYTLDAAASVPSVVTTNAGVGRI